jgi:GAG-pre-integrase domain
MFLLLYAWVCAWQVDIIRTMLVLVLTQFIFHHFPMNAHNERIANILKIKRKPPYVPARFRRNARMDKFKQALIRAFTIFSNICCGMTHKLRELIPVGYRKSKRNCRGQKILKKNSSRVFALRGVKIRYRRMMLCSLLSTTSKRLSHPNADTISFQSLSSHRKQAMGFDTDSVPIKIDNCCTRTMSFCKRDFISGTMKPVRNLTVRGYGGTSTIITHKGTIEWKIQDDEGTTQTLTIPNSYYVPTSSNRLLSPQHMAQQMNDHYPVKRGTWCATYDDAICLQWNQRQHTKTVQLDPKSSNVGTIWTIPGYRAHHKFYATMWRTIQTWDKQPECNEVDLTEEQFEDPIPSTHEEKGSICEPGETEHRCSTTEFQLNGPIQEEKKRERYTSTDSEELLQWHNKLSHVSMKRIQRMAAHGHLPSRIAKCQIPLCQSCLYGKQTRKPWRHKPSNSKLEAADSKTPGACVSVDQLESTTLGLIGQMKGKLTKSRYRVATVFVDHYSNLGYVYLQTSTNAVETVRAKVEFEKYARTFGVEIKHYHADNGRFSDNLWREDVINKGQQLSFCGVGAHHQNGRAEKRIRDAQDHARTSLIHANRRWPEAIDARLWPYALR